MKIDEKKVIGKNGFEFMLRTPNGGDAQGVLDHVHLVNNETDYLAWEPREFSYTLEQESKVLNNCERSPNSIFICAVHKQNIVGVLNFSAPTRAKMKHSGELGMSVQKNFWQKGIGRALLEKLLEKLKAENVFRKVKLGVRSDNTNAIKLYESCGFEITGVEKQELYSGGKYNDLTKMEMQL